MDITPEIGYELLKEHEALIRDIVGKNEADTRLRAIDTLLFDVLKWDKSQVEVEKYSREVGYADYVFSTGSSFSLVLEAKKEGDWFILPSTKITANPIGFALLAKECPSAEKALRQALGYAASLGTKYIAISNGHQWILALTFVQNQTIDQRSVFAFASLDQICNTNFREFFHCFSPAAIETNAPSNKLLESRKLPAPAKLSATIPSYPNAAERKCYCKRTLCGNRRGMG